MLKLVRFKLFPYTNTEGESGVSQFVQPRLTRSITKLVVVITRNWFDYPPSLESMFQG